METPLYLKKFSLVNSDNCINNNTNSVDNVEHMLLECKAWEKLRKDYNIDASVFSIGNKNEEFIKNFSAFATKVLQQKHKY